MSEASLVQLVAIDADNRALALALAPKPEQKHFVASNAYSLDQAAGSDACVPLLIVAHGEAVGFAMYALEPEDGHYWIYRMMVDADHQGKGYGTAAITALTKLIFDTTNCPLIALDVKPENVIARRLSESAGFLDAGYEIEGEPVMHLYNPAG
jgi:diamine N-acetyltransferase